MIWGTILEFWRSVRERERGKDMAKSYPPDRMFPSIYLTSLAMVATRKAMLDYQRKVIFGNKLFYSIRKNLWFWGNFKSECCARIERGARDFAFFAHQFCAAKMYRIELNFAQCTELGSILRKNVQNILRKNVQNWAELSDGPRYELRPARQCSIINERWFSAIFCSIGTPPAKTPTLSFSDVFFLLFSVFDPIFDLFFFIVCGSLISDQPSI